MDNLLDAFAEKFPGISITYTGDGSNAGIQSLLNNDADAIMLSRAPTAEEMDALQKNGDVELREVAYDGITIILNRTNHVDHLTMEQLRDIFSGKIKTWGFAGFENIPISVYVRNLNSGTYVFFKNHVLDSLDYGVDAIRCVSNEDIVRGVKHDEGAIGYIGMDFDQGEVKAIALSADGGENFIDNGRPNIHNKRYPLTRPLYIAYYKKNKAQIWTFVDYLFSEKGQEIINNSGFISLDK